MFLGPSGTHAVCKQVGLLFEHEKPRAFASGVSHVKRNKKKKTNDKERKKGPMAVNIVLSKTPIRKNNCVYTRLRRTEQEEKRIKEIGSSNSS
jgi:hypothetical protein